MTLDIIVFTVSLFFLTRLVFIIGGLHKGPILELFEKYGDPPPVYFPWTQVLIWLGLAVIFGGRLVNDWGVGMGAVTSFLGISLLVLAWGSHVARERLIEYIEEWPQIPLWYGRLIENTSRVERRRIAYMWLRLPVRTRWLYSASDKFFFQWADLVIMATLHES